MTEFSLEFIPICSIIRSQSVNKKKRSRDARSHRYSTRAAIAPYKCWKRLEGMRGEPGGARL